MNRGLVVIAIVMTLLCIQSNAKRFLLDEVKKEKNDITKDDGANLQAVNSDPYGKPATGSVDEANNENHISNSSASNNINHDDYNESYGNSSNPSGATPDSHHIYTGNCKTRTRC
ncbi:hypothetical protein TorRG33x02_350370 [Trema orientale]|uniref:Uncharacterized protein n=1 Tax=Trema orientale TaxID=63057 RepID=A0A2P5AHE9_TREOI|nr:hypothetical protein TorRG33x02_350370 [Trema orientale]